jgi:predicted amidohydrolase YtcJ
MSREVSRRAFLQAAATGVAAGLTATLTPGGLVAQPAAGADLILFNGRVATQDARRSFASAVAIKDGRFLAVGADQDVLASRHDRTQMIDVGGRTVIPGLNDSHMHPIRGGLNYNLELRWDGVPSLADALRMLRAQAQRTPPPQWVRVVGGWTAFQFAERRMPTLDEINAVAPDTPVFVLHLYDRAFLNQAAVRAVGYTKETPDPPGGEIQRDRAGHPTGLLIARPNASILYATLAKGPKLSRADQRNSTRQFMRELNRFGITSVIDAGGGFQNYPEDYEVIQALHHQGELTVRLAYNLFTQKPQQELEDFTRWSAIVQPGQGDAYYRMNGAGEMLVFSAADFEDFLEPRPDLPATLEAELTRVVTLLAKQRWPFRIHATYDASITRILNVYEAVNREVPFEGLHWFIDHAETISRRNLERVKHLGGGIAVQDRMAFQGEYFLDRYGKQAAEQAPPIQAMLAMEIPVGAGTDATRVSSYNPWLSLYWLVTGKTVGGTALSPDHHRLDRMEALRLYTVGSSWFSSEDGQKGAIVPGQLADLAVLSADYFAIADEQITRLESLLTVVGGRVVYGAGAFAPFAPPPLPVSPDWSPVATYGGYPRQAARATTPARHVHASARHGGAPRGGGDAGGRTVPVQWRLTCDCFAF